MDKNTKSYMKLFDDALIGTFCSTLDGKFLYVNKAFSNILKYDSPEDVIHSVKNIEGEIYAKNTHWQLLEEIEGDGKLSNYQVQCYCKDRSIITVLLNIHIKKDKQENTLYLEGFIHDITPLKEKEEQLKKNEQMLQELNDELESALQQLSASEEELCDNYNRLKEKEADLVYQKNSFECLFNNSLDAIIHFDENKYIINVNQQFIELFGYTLQELKGKYINDIIDPFSQVEYYLTYANLEKGDCKFRDTLRYDKHGNPIKVFVKGVPIVINNKVVGGYAIYTDARPIKEAEEQIKKQQQRLEFHFNYSPDAIVYLDMNHNIQEINKKFTDLFGYSASECIGKNIQNLIIGEEYLEESQLINDLIHKKQTVEIDTFRRRKDGIFIDVCVRGGPTIVDGQITGYHVIYTDIRTRKEAEERIKYLSYHDNLTGLYNRAFFEEELKRLDTQRQMPLAVIIGDVNGLKLTNDVFGHLQGDKLLVKTAEILKEACRREDIVCRWGGDEFAILLTQTDKETARVICHRIYSLCKQSDTEPINISISLGYAVKYRSDQFMTDIIKEAEEQMYRNKLLENKSTRSSIILSLQKSLYEGNYETEEHVERMKLLSIKLGKSLNLDNDKISELGLLAILHDIGKIAISDTILLKPGKLTPEEWEEVKRHCEIGYRIAQTSPELTHIAKYILFHHERWDGKGYPRGLKGDEIPLLCRIIAVIDAYDVMTHCSIYKESLSHKEALDEILRCSGSQFDPEIVTKFIGIF